MCFVLGKNEARFSSRRRYEKAPAVPAVFKGALCQIFDQLKLSGLRGLAVRNRSSGGVRDKVGENAEVPSLCGVEIGKSSLRCQSSSSVVCRIRDQSCSASFVAPG